MNRSIVSYVLLLISVYRCFAESPIDNIPIIGQVHDLIDNMMSQRDNNNCWWSGCQPNTWAQRGCPDGYNQINSKPCDNGDMYECCPNGGQTGPGGQTSPSGQAAESGKCSWYGAEGEIPQGWPTSSGEGFDRFALKAAHKTLPFGTPIRVKNESNGKTVDVTINDRGPYCPAGVSCPPVEIRIVDLTYAAMQQIANLDTGVIPCSYQKL